MRALLDVQRADRSVGCRSLSACTCHDMVCRPCARRLGGQSYYPKRLCVQLSHPGYPNALSVRAVMERLTGAGASAFHEFWPDDISLLTRKSPIPHASMDRARLPTSTCSRSRFGMADGSSHSIARFPWTLFGVPRRKTSSRYNHSRPKFSARPRSERAALSLGGGYAASPDLEAGVGIEPASTALQAAA